MSESPLTSIFLSKAKQNEVGSDMLSERRDSLLNAYKKLIEAQQYSKPNVNNVENGIMGAALLSGAKDPGLRGFGEGTAQQLKYLLGEDDKMKQSIKQQAETFAQMNKANLDFADSDRELQYKYLMGAANSDYRDEMSRLKELMLMQKMSEASSEDAGNSYMSDPSELGVPVYDGPDPYAGMDKVGKRQTRQIFEKKVSKEQDAATEYQSAIEKMKRFQQLNEEAKDDLIGTGPIADYVPTYSEGLQEMDTIASELIPQMRVPGSGSTSDFDARMFTKATVGTSKDYDVNKNISEAYILSKQNQMDKANFLEAYLTAHGHLRGAEKSWKQYLNDNPIFLPSNKNKDFKLNENRTSWEEYFGKKDNKVSDGTTKTEPVVLIPQGIEKELWDHLTDEEKDTILRKRGM